MAVGIDDSPPDGCHQYGSIGDVPLETRKYWIQRHNLFSKFDDGVWLTEKGWYEVTPEPIADAIASRIAEQAPKDASVIIDCFAGLGGNTIAFAKSGRFSQIFAVEKDKMTLECAKHNAAIYGVKGKIFFIHGDIFEALKLRFKAMTKKTVLFASPPWGGPNYNKDKIFDLSLMEPYNLATLVDAMKPFRAAVLYLPRNSDLQQLAEVVGDETESRTDVIHYCINRASKALCLYTGDLHGR